jgi:predicted cupin superfamily sugar epimerase
MTGAPTWTVVHDSLGLHQHEEGGYFAETFAADSWSVEVPWPGGRRSASNSIYYALTADSPRAYLHRNRCDLVHYFHCGGSLEYLLLGPDESFSTVRLGSRIQEGELLQLRVPGGTWKATRLVEGDFGLLSEVASPGWDMCDRDFATADDVARLEPELRELLATFLRPGDLELWR